MRVVIFLIFCIFASTYQSELDFKGNSDEVSRHGSCNEFVDVTWDYRAALYEFDITFYKAIAARNDLNFVYSPLSIWLTLAGIAEGVDPYTQHQLFNLLNLPKDPCIRQKYYQLATTRFSPSDDVYIINYRALLTDTSVTINPYWYNIIESYSLFNILTAPIKQNPVGTAAEIRWLMSARLPSLNLNGNSVLLETMDYSGLWTNAFGNAKIEKLPFFNQVGYQIGSVDMMRFKRRARMGYIKAIKCKVLEIPVGKNGRYKMLFMVFLNTHDPKEAVQGVTKNNVRELFENLRESYVPLDIAIPRIRLTSEVDVRVMLEDLGITSLWNNPEATRNISYPPVLPSSYIQRATLTIDNHGLQPSPIEREPAPGSPTGLHPIVGADFIANRPFMFALFDTETLSVLLASAYSTPTYKW